MGSLVDSPEADGADAETLSLPDQYCVHSDTYLNDDAYARVRTSNGLNQSNLIIILSAYVFLN